MKKKSEQTLLPQLLTLQESAGVLNISMKTLRRRIDEDQLPVIRDVGVVRVHPRDLENYIASRRTF